MGGYGSGKSATRQGAEESRRFPVHYAAEALRRVRAEQVEPGQLAHADGVVSWTSRGRPNGSMSYTVAEGPRGLLLVLSYTLGGREEIRDALGLVEKASNLGAGHLVYIRCECGQFARVLYLDDRRGRFRCRRCVPVVYESSRTSSAAVSRVLSGILDDLKPDAEALGLPLARLGAAQMAGRLRDSTAGLFLALKVLDKLGQGLSPDKQRPLDYWHGSAGRPWSPARRAAQGRRG